MACNVYTISGLDNSCKSNSVGGIKRILVALDEDVQSVHLDTQSGTTPTDAEIATAMMIDTITMANGKKFVEYKLLKNLSSLVSTMNVSDTSVSYTNELALQFTKQEAAKRLEIMGLMMMPCKVIVEDGNSKYWYLGYNNSVECSAGTATTDTASTGNNHYELTLQDISSVLPFEVDADIIANLL